MSDVAIKVEDLGKKFIIGHNKSQDLRNAFGDRLKKILRPGHREKEDFWALRDVSFEIRNGEAVGIIGRNGAGKSTLLKILSRITEPSVGRFEINGRVSSLLEVGTGFHMELTGRENVYLNGTILGMKRAEIKAKFDEIVAFSGIEKFIDTPVKHYSSGMKVRLAFSVAAHLEPEILIIDEVLAVGDAEFQKKCLGKMDEVSKNQGRTVLFVSHNMDAVKNLCSKAMLIQGGQIQKIGNTVDVISEYRSTSITGSHREFTRPGGNTHPAYVKSICIEDHREQVTNHIEVLKSYRIKVRFHVEEFIPHFILGIGFTTLEDFPVRTTFTKPNDISKGEYEAIFEEKDVFLAAGRYRLIIGLSSREITFQYVAEAIDLHIEDNPDKTVAIRASNGLIANQQFSTINKLAP